MTKAVALLSGGLDSTLAIKVMQEQGIEVEALNFTSIFCNCSSGSCGTGSCGTDAAPPAKEEKGTEGMRAAQKLDVPVKVLSTTHHFLEILKNPKHGYGAHMNPCIDCRIGMLKTAANYMEETNSEFLITGEVLGQRPMSQRREAMKTVEQEAGLEGRVVRPLSAKFLDETIPEKEGKFDSANLPAITGRSRKPQMELADIFEIKDYPCAAGGCALTDAEFAGRVQDLLEHTEDQTVNDYNLLKNGRHFRLDPNSKAVVGRDEAENYRLLGISLEGDVRIALVDHPGPTVLLRGDLTEQNIRFAGGLAARYSKAKEEPQVRVKVTYARSKREPYELEVRPVAEAESEPIRIQWNKEKNKAFKRSLQTSAV